MSKKFNLGWHGSLTMNNIHDVVALFEELLRGKRYTFTASNELSRFKPEVKTGQKLEGAFNVWVEKEYAGFNASDSSGVWGLSTHLKEEVYDGTFENPYIVFEWNKVTMTHKSGSGHLLYWVLAVEE